MSNIRLLDMAEYQEYINTSIENDPDVVNLKEKTGIVVSGFIQNKLWDWFSTFDIEDRQYIVENYDYEKLKYAFKNYNRIMKSVKS